MSKPERNPRSYHPKDILKALKSDETPKQIALVDQSFPYPSRLAVLMTESGSNAFYMSRKTIRQRTNPVDDAEMKKGFDTVERWGLFKRGADGKYRRAYDPGETPKEFRKRVLQRIDVELAILCILSDITVRCEVPAPHSISEFADELHRGRKVIIKCVGNLVKDGYIIGWARGSTRRSLWARPDYTSVIYNLDEKLDRIIGTDPRYGPRRSLVRGDEHVRQSSLRSQR